MNLRQAIIGVALVAMASGSAYAQDDKGDLDVSKEENNIGTVADANGVNRASGSVRFADGRVMENVALNDKGRPLPLDVQPQAVRTEVRKATNGGAAIQYDYWGRIKSVTKYSEAKGN
jgi:hypothetical protein